MGDLSSDQILNFEKAGEVRLLERDYFLDLHNKWPRPPEGWHVDGESQNPEKEYCFRFIQDRDPNKL